MNTDVRFAHLAIDPQKRYLSDLLPERRKSFPLSLRKFADRIYPVPTIWIGVDWSPSRYVTSSMPDYHELIKHMELEAVGIRDYEDVFSKNTEDAFSVNRRKGGDKLKIHLLQKYPKLETIIITGLNTPYCVIDTMFGARNNQFKCWGIYDLMADGDNRQSEINPAWHKDLLRRMGVQGSKAQSDMDVINQRTCLARLQDQLAPDLSMVANRSQKLCPLLLSA